MPSSEPTGKEDTTVLKTSSSASSKSPTAGGSTTGTLSISADQGNIYVNNSFRGRASVTLTSLPPGAYTVQARRTTDDTVCWTRNVRVKAGKTTTLRVNTSCP